MPAPPTDCPACGYPLQGLLAPRCPECGLDVQGPAARERQRRRDAARFGVVVVAAPAAVFVSLGATLVTAGMLYAGNPVGVMLTLLTAITLFSAIVAAALHFWRRA